MSSGSEILFFIFAAIAGFVIGGIYGVAFDAGFFPDAWYGLCVVIGIPVVATACH